MGTKSRNRTGLSCERLEDRTVPALIWGDFNRDGYEDLAIGSPGETVNEQVRAGEVHVVYGSPAGLGARSSVLRQGERGMDDYPEAGDRFGQTLAVGDFNADRYDDLAIGVPGEDRSAGAVQIVYGTATGLNPTGPLWDVLWTQDTGNLGYSADSEAGDRFGVALAVGDFDHNGCDDLAIGVPGEDRENAWASDDTDAGAVVVLYGTGWGLDNWYSTHGQGNDGTSYEPEDGDEFGYSLAVGDFDGDGYADLAVGVPGEGIEVSGPDPAAAGVVEVFRGARYGITSAGTQVFRQGSGAVPGTPGDYDRFGEALAAGDFDGDRIADLAVGAPGDTLRTTSSTGAVTTVDAAGSVTVVRGTSYWGLSDQTAVSWSLGGTGPDLAPRAFNFFGSRLSAGDLNGDGRDELLVGSPQATVGGQYHAGAVYAIYGPTVTTASPRVQVWTQNTPGVDGVAEYLDEFGSSVAVGDADGDGRADLAAAAPGEDVHGAVDTGAVNVIYSAGAPTVTRTRLLTQYLLGWASEDDDRFS